jgi:hypothetical protein
MNLALHPSTPIRYAYILAAPEQKCNNLKLEVYPMLRLQIPKITATQDYRYFRVWAT